jgi:hypothetical protein
VRAVERAILPAAEAERREIAPARAELAARKVLGQQAMMAAEQAERLHPAALWPRVEQVPQAASVEQVLAAAAARE